MSFSRCSTKRQKAKAGDLLPGLASGPEPMWGEFATDRQHKH